MGRFSGAARPSASDAPTLGKTATAYDAEYTTVTDPAGKTRRSRLDGLGRLARVDEPTGSPSALGAAGSPNQATAYSYNALDNLTRVTQGAQTRTFAYDSLSRLTSASNPESGTMAYSYDRAGNLTRQRYPSDRVIDYVYDGAGRIAGAKTGADGWYAGGTGGNAVKYEPHGGVRQLLLGNGLWEQRRYNARLQPIQIGLGTGKTAGGTALGTTQSGVLLLDYSYGTASNNGNVLSQRIRVGTSLNQNQAYTYDALNRLKTAAESGSGAAWSKTYAYDRFGNRRVTAGASHGSNPALTPQSTSDIAAGTNRLAGTKGVNTVAYDAAGNLTADWATNAFKYDGDNRLVAFDHPTGTDSDTTYAYDGEGRRVQKVVGGTSGVATTYVYNVLGRLVAEYANPWTRESGTRYLTPDHLGSTRVVTAEDQSVLSRHDYLPFGEEIGAALGNRDRGK